ncbi:MAG: nucleotidyltransferase family protein [Bacteroidetes bacterium]|nr:nucleotidyltransferase family protein [Bacteroidota bacterium]
MIREVIILAGGLGTRLQKSVPDLPKSMAPVGGHPFLEYQMQYLEEWGIKKFILAVGHKHEMIRDYFGDRFKNVEIVYSIEDDPLGTGGAIMKAMQLADSGQVLVANGDTYFDVHLNRMYNFHLSRTAKITIALHQTDDVSRYGKVVKDAEHRITGFFEKGEDSGAGYVNGGVYLINQSYLAEMEFPVRFSFEKDFLEKRYKNDEFYGMRCTAYFLDIGIPEDYERAQDDFEGLLH